MSTYEKLYGKFESGFFATSSIGVLVQSCVGGIAAMAVLTHGNSLVQMMQLFIVVACGIGYNGAILSQQTPRVVYNLLIASITINVLLAVINFAR